MRISALAQRALPWILAGIILLIPVFIVPGIASSIILPKFLLLLFGSSLVLLLLLLLKMHDTHAVKRLFRSPVVFLTLLLLGISAASAMVSVGPQDSLIGFDATTIRSLLALVALFVLLLVVSQMSKLRGHTILIRALVFAPVVPVILTVLGFLGVFPKLFVQNGTVAGFFPDLFLLSAAGLLAAIAASSVWSGLWRISAIISAVLLLIFGVLAFSQPTWLVVVIGGILLLAILLRNNFASTLRSTAILLPAFTVGLAALFALGVISPIRFAVPIQVAPAFTASASVAKDVLRENPLLGYGPGQWSNAYAKYLPDDINLTSFWNVRFATGSSELSTIPTEKGMLGAFAWLALMGAVLYGLWKKILIKARPLREVGIYLPAALFFLTVLVGQMTYFPASISVEPLFWVAIGIVTALGLGVQKSTDTQKPPKNADMKTDAPQGSSDVEGVAIGNVKISQGILALIAFVGIALLSVGVFGATRLVASKSAAEGLNAFAQRDSAEAAGLFFSAVSLDGSNASYWQRLADALLGQLLNEAEKGADADIVQLRRLAENTQNAIRTATRLRPASANVWAQQARIYEQIFGYGIEGADSEALLAWDNAIEREPRHPGYLTGRGVFRLSLLASSENTDTDKIMLLIEEARADFIKAIEVKSDFAEAHLQLGLTAAAAGNFEEAISATENALRAAPGTIPYGFQLALFYMAAERQEEAMAIFEEILALEPEHANARYQLAILQARDGKTDDALINLDRLIEQNPEQTLLVQVRENVASNIDPLDGVNSGEPQVDGAPSSPPAEPLIP